MTDTNSTAYMEGWRDGVLAFRGIDVPRINRRQDEADEYLQGYLQGFHDAAIIMKDGDLVEVAEDD